MGKLTVNADADWTFWSSYSSLPINFETPLLPDSNAAKNWEDVVAVRLGIRPQLEGRGHGSLRR